MSRTILLACLVLAGSAATARDHTSGHLVIGHPWSRPAAAGIPTGVAYLTITNNGPKEEVLLGARTAAAQRVEMHHTIVSEGMARMRPLPQITIPAGSSVKVEPGGIHLMLVGLKAPLTAGDEIPLTLVFREAGDVEVEIKVEARDAAAL
jgi:copper(I)-binding protein